MRLYHGSTIEVSAPSVARSRRNLDFGPGFYATSFRSQAERWARRKAVFESATPIVNVYELSEDLSAFRVLEFPRNDGAWLDFVCACRRGELPCEGYDLVVGGVADDKVYEAVSLYYRGIWDRQTTLSALRFYGRNDQYCFVTQEAVDALLSFVSSYEV